MITALVGPPGSGKSLDMARLVFRDLSEGRDTYVVSNVPINLEYFSETARERFRYVSNEELKDARILIKIATEYWANHYAKNHDDAEDRLHLYIDECQILFNAREWQNNKYWATFFSVHRHYGFRVYLMTQMLTSIDKQVRGVIEYYIQHRKVSNFGMFGWFLGVLTRNRLFVAVTVWAPLDEKVYSEFFLYRDKLGKIYNTHALFNLDGTTSEGVIRYVSDVKKTKVALLDSKEIIEAEEVTGNAVIDDHISNNRSDIA